MYNNSMVSLRIVGGETREFSYSIVLHQSVALSLYLFTLVVDGLTKHIQDHVTCY